MARTIKARVGIPGKLRDVEFEIPDDAPRPWDANDKLRYIGQRVTRVDGQAKATGAAKYTFDIQLPGMLHARFLRSPHAAAAIKSIDTSAAEKYPGVKAIHLLQAPPIALRFAGQEILAVAATTPHAAYEALKRIKVDYEIHPFVLDVETAMRPNAPKVYSTAVEEKTTEGDLPGAAAKVKQSGNIRGPKINKKFKTGNSIEALDAAFALSDVVVEETYRTQVQTHCAMETHGVVARWEADGQLTVWASTQGTFGVRDELAEVLKLPKSKVRVLTEYMGGAFGAKFGAGIYGITAAKLSEKAKAPVRLMYDRKEEHLASGNRPNSIQQLKIGAKRDGTLTAIKLISHGTAGVGTGAGTAGPATNLYACDAIWAEESDVFTNAGPAAAFRAPGHPQGMYALEQAIDELAYKLNMDPLELRKKNTQYDEVRALEYELGAEKVGWKKRNPHAGADRGIVKRGIGVANSLWYYFHGKGFQVALQVNSDGTVEVMSGVQDIGTGIRTAMAAIVAEELGLHPEEINLKIGDTNFGLAPASGGSTTTAGMAAPTRDAAYAAKIKMLDIAASLLKIPSEELRCSDGAIFHQSSPQTRLTWKQVAAKMNADKFTVMGERKDDYRKVNPSFLRGLQFAEVEVDTETGIVRVVRVVAVHDCGRPMNRLTIESQINGGVLQGISYALFEDRILDRNTGIMVNPNLEQYKIGGSLDTPQIESIIIDNDTAMNSAPAMGIGEPATVPTSAAIANAIYHAIGVRVRELPMTPDRILAALAAQKG